MNERVQYELALDQQRRLRDAAHLAYRLREARQDRGAERQVVRAGQERVAARGAPRLREAE
jgi:hypothetical protein